MTDDTKQVVWELEDPSDIYSAAPVVFQRKASCGD
jgi:hypothetical protein